MEFQRGRSRARDCRIDHSGDHAVGHETDTTLADFAADRRAPTPTAAAEMAVPVRAELMAGLADLEARRQRALGRQLAQARERLDQRARRLPPPHALLSGQAQRLDDLGERLRRSLGHRTELAAAMLARHAGSLRPALLETRLRRERERLLALRLRPEALLQRIETARGRVDALDRLRRSLDPEAPLARGYVLVTDSAGRVIKTRAAATGEAELTLKFADGSLGVVPAGTGAGGTAASSSEAADTPSGASQSAIVDG